MNYNSKKIDKLQQQFTSQAPRTRHHLVFIFTKIILLLIAAILVLVSIFMIGELNSIIQNAPDLSEVQQQTEGYDSVILTSEHQRLQQLSTSSTEHRYKTIDEIPVHLQNAFIAIEDKQFYQHHGILISGFFKDIWYSIRTQSLCEESSTITQQLIKNNVFSVYREGTFREQLERNIQGQYLALQLEKDTDKQTILEYYLNSISLGQNTLGVEAAAQYYFHKSVSELSLSESTVLAAIAQNPIRLDPVSNPEQNQSQQVNILKTMLDQQMISQQEWKKALRDPVYERIHNIHDTSQDNTSASVSDFSDAVVQEVINDLQEQKGYTQTQAYHAVYNGGLTIYSTQSSTIQKICDDTISANTPDPVSVAILDQKTGYVKAIVGNSTIRTARQPGSVFQILSTYIPAIDTAGMTLSTAYPDGTLRDGIHDAKKEIALKAMKEVTPQVGFDYLQNLGFSTLRNNQSSENREALTDIKNSLSLGQLCNGVTNMDLTAAYASIANQGIYHKPILYTKVMDRNGNLLLENESLTRQVMKDSTAWLITDAMADAGLTDMNSAAVSTTVDENGGAWYTGFTPYYTASLWMEYDKQASSESDKTHILLWKQIMDKIDRAYHLQQTDFPVCTTVASASICRKSGKLAIEGICPKSAVRNEYFAVGTIPTEECDIHHAE
ncbi:MAG: transglycosylase domain-containing protein [Lachnospiraceae bacterium]